MRDSRDPAKPGEQKEEDWNSLTLFGALNPCHHLSFPFFSLPMPQAQQFQSKTHSKNTPTNIIHFLLAACCRMQQCLNKIKSKQPWKKNKKKQKQTTIDQLLLKQSLEQTELSCWIGGSMHVCKSTVTVTWKSRICKNVSLIVQLI